MELLEGETLRESLGTGALPILKAVGYASQWAQGLAAAGRALSLADRGVVEIEGTTAWIDTELCSGCRECLELCPAGAIREAPAADAAEQEGVVT